MTNYADYFTKNPEGNCTRHDEPRHALDSTSDCESSGCDVKRVDRVRQTVGEIPDAYKPERLRVQDRLHRYNDKDRPNFKPYGTKYSQPEYMRYRKQALSFADPKTYIVDTSKWGDKAPQVIEVLLLKRSVCQITGEPPVYRLSLLLQKERRKEYERGR